MSEVTKQDLADAINNIKQHISDKMEPVTKDINGHQITLYGKEGRNGLVGDVNDMKAGIGLFKWLAGTGFILMLGKWWHSLS